MIRRAGTEGSADLFLEPPPGDCHQKDFMIIVMYEDGQAGNAKAKAAEHTKPDLRSIRRRRRSPRLDARVYLTGDEKLFGKLESIGQETLKLTTPWQDHLDVPLTRVVGVHFGLLERKESRSPSPSG